MSAIKLEGLTKRFGDTVAVDGLTLTVEKGSITGLLGPNGAGKTTAIKMMLGLLRADEGRGAVFGLDIDKDSVAIRSKTGYMGEADQIYGYMTVKAALAFCKAFYPRWNDDLVRRYLDMFELSPGKKVKEMSKGMKVRLNLVLALAPEPELLILDEPTAGLDPLARHEFLQIMLDEVAQTGRTVLFSTHILQDIEKVADTVAMMKKGKLLEISSVDDLKTNLKKVRVVFQQEPEEGYFDVPGVAGVSRQGSAYFIDVDDNMTEVLAHIKKVPHFVLEIIDQNLEEIFMEKIKKGDKK